MKEPLGNLSNNSLLSLQNYYEDKNIKERQSQHYYPRM
jgi:hypothetical protein